jgi:thymidine kinase
MNLFPGSERLLAIADTIEEIKNICVLCESKATQNVRFVDGKITFDGDQVAIDGTHEVTYKAYCGKHYIEAYMNEMGMTLERKK